MKDSEFIELLNLYLDHEISPADAARLEAEVQSNAERRKIYQQYCRMQKACKVLATDFATEPVAAAADKKVVAFDRAAAEVAGARRRRMGNLYTIGTFAAAACVAVIVVTRNQQSATEQASMMAQHSTAVVQPAASSVPAIAAQSVVMTAEVSSGPRPLGKIVTDPLQLAGKAQADALQAAAMEQTKQFAWLETKLPPLQMATPVKELRFEQSPATLSTDGRALGGNRTGPRSDVEMTAFQFVK